MLFGHMLIRLRPIISIHQGQDVWTVRFKITRMSEMIVTKAKAVCFGMHIISI